MDMWSIGCIVAEMLSNRPIFPGKNYLDQIQKIQEVLGTPTQDETSFILNPKARAFLESLPNQQRKPWARMYPRAEGTPGAFDLLDKLLAFDPRKRYIFISHINKRFNHINIYFNYF